MGNNRINLNLGDQNQLIFTKSNSNYFINFSGFNTEEQKAGLCFYSLLENDLKRQYMFNNTVYNIQSFNTLEIPFVSSQSGMNITLQDIESLPGYDLESYNLNNPDSSDDGEVFDILNVQICGIYRMFTSQSNEIPYETEIYQNNMNSLYFYQNLQFLDSEEEHLFKVSEYKIYVNNLYQSSDYILSLNSINLRSKKSKMYPKMIIKKNIVGIDQQNDPSKWNYPKFQDLDCEEKTYLLDIGNQNSQFLNSEVLQCNLGDTNCGAAITIFYVYSYKLGKFKSSFINLNLQKCIVTPINNQQSLIGQQQQQGFLDITQQVQNSAQISGEFELFNQFKYFTFNINQQNPKQSKQVLKISQKGEKSQPAFQICENIIDGEEDEIICQQQQFYSQLELQFDIDKEGKIQQKTFYMIMTPQKQSNLLGQIKQKFSFQVSQQLEIIASDLVIQRNFGNKNTFAVQIYDNSLPKLQLSISFLSLKLSVPKSAEFINGHITSMDQYVTFCNKDDLIDCNLYAHETDKDVSEQTFYKIVPIAGLYSMNLNIPEKATFAIVYQEIYVQSNLTQIQQAQYEKQQQIQQKNKFLTDKNTNNEPQNQNMNNKKYFEYVGATSQTMQAQILPGHSSSDDWKLLLYMGIGVVFLAILLVVYCVLSKKSDKNKQLEKEEKERKRKEVIQSLLARDIQSSNETIQSQMLAPTNNMTVMDADGNTMIHPNTTN